MHIFPAKVQSKPVSLMLIIYIFFTTVDFMSDGRTKVVSKIVRLLLGILPEIAVMYVYFFSQIYVDWTNFVTYRTTCLAFL